MQIASALTDVIQPTGVGVVVEATWVIIPRPMWKGVINIFRYYLDIMLICVCLSAMGHVAWNKVIWFDLI